MNDKDLLQGFHQCSDEIKSLRSENKELTIEISAMNRVLTAVNSHVPDTRNMCASEDILWNIKDTCKFLEKRIKSEPTTQEPS